MKKIWVLIFFSFFLSGCLTPSFKINNTNSQSFLNEPPPAAEVWLTYAPQQCVTPPWQEWYQSGRGPKYFVKPTEEQLAHDYLSFALNIETKKVEKVQPTDVVVCQACVVCPQGYYINVLVNRSDRSKLLELGWQDAIKVRE